MRDVDLDRLRGGPLHIRPDRTRGDVRRRTRRLRLHPGGRGPRRGERVRDGAAGRRHHPQLSGLRRPLPRRGMSRDWPPYGAGHWQDRPLSDLLEAHGLERLPERAFPTDGWSGARFSMIEAPGDPPERYVLKRTSPAIDWIAAATADETIREATLAASDRVARDPSMARMLPYLGAAADDDGSAVIVMPDLSTELLAWERTAHDAAEIDVEVVDRTLDRLAALHVRPWSFIVDPAAYDTPETRSFPWCPLPERLTLTARPTCARHIARGIPAGVESAGKLLVGWDAFDRTAPGEARELIASLGADPGPLVAALGRLPAVGLHGDLKLANVAVGPGHDQIRFIDWQMTI